MTECRGVCARVRGGAEAGQPEVGEEQQVVRREWDTGIQDFRGGAVSADDETQGVTTGVGS